MTPDAPDQPTPNSEFADGPFLSRRLLDKLLNRLPEHQHFVQEVLVFPPNPSLAEKLKTTIEQRHQTLAGLEAHLYRLPVISSAWVEAEHTYLRVGPACETEAELWESTWWEIKFSTRTGELLTYTSHKFRDTYQENQRRQAQRRRDSRRWDFL